MKKSVMIFIGLLLFSFVAVSADDFNFEITPIKNQVDAGESARFTVTITNNMNDIQEFTIYTTDIEWDIPSEAIKAYPKGDTEYELVMTPLKHFEPGDTQEVKVNIRNSETGNTEYSERVNVMVKSIGEVFSSYRPSVKMEVEVPPSIDPKEAVMVRVKLDNKNLLDLNELVMKVSSEINAFEAEQNVDLVPLGKKVIELNYNLDPLQTPGDYRVTFEIIQKGEVIQSETKTVSIRQVKLPFIEQLADSGFLFRSVITKTITSESNVEEIQTVKIPTSFIGNIFTSTVPESREITEEGHKYLAIDLALQPGESKDVQVVRNYRPWIIILLMIIVIVILYLRYKSPIVIRKGISDVDTREGGISELKVTLELKSSAKKTIKNVKVTDYVPNIASIQKEFIEGTVKPKKIFKHSAKGTVIIWELDEVTPGEHRLISYNIKSKLSIVGDMKLPRAKVKFKQKRKQLISYSNQATVSS